MGERLWRSGRRHPVTVAIAAACSLIVLAGVVIAWQRPGFAEVPPQPVDRSVWVVNDARLLVGRVNTGIGELDSATALRGVSSVVQDPAGKPADPLLLVDGAKDEIQLLDTATVTFGARVAVPADAAIGLRSGTVAVADRADGRVWVGTIRGAGPNPDLSAVDVRTAPPAATIGAGTVLAVSVEGVVFAVRPGASSIVRIDPGDPAAVSDVPLAGEPLSTSDPIAAASAGDRPGVVQLTAVGGVPVVLDRTDRSVRVGERRLAVTLPADAVLQDPGPDAPEVLVSSASGLVAVNLTDGSTRPLAAGGGIPVPPVVAGGCRYAAWASGPRVTGVAGCGDGPAEPVELAGAGTVDPGTAAPVLTLQARGDAVVLVDATADRSWIASDGFRPVDNWPDVVPRDGPADRTTTVEDPTSTDDLPDVPPDCTAVPVEAPTAVDDDFGVRAGRTTVLRVLDNDPGVDCTGVVVESVGTVPPEVGSVTVVGDGSAVQLTIAPGVTAVPSIEYTVGNGQDATATARITVRVQPAGVHEPAERVRRSAVTSEVDATVSYNVLDDMLSPTGDDLFLVSAATDTADVVSFRPDGTITYRNTGGGSGTDVPVEFVVSDGVEQATGTLTVSVVPVGSSAPVIYPAYGRTAPGTAAVVDLRRSVVSGSADPVVIDAVQAEPRSESATAALDRRTGSVAVSAAEPGTYYFTFEATAGGRGTTGVLRVDVTGADLAAPPVPMLDLAYLPAGGETVIDPTLNDGGAAGAGSAVQDVRPPAGAALTAAVVDLHLVRISATRPLREPVDLSYVAFDGAAGSGGTAGTIRVVPVPAARVTPPPLTAPAQATVRAGDAVTIPITSFTTSQDGAPVRVTLDPVQVAAVPGAVFVTADSIRYLAPADAAPGQLGFGYTASSGTATALAPAQAAGTVTITVVAPDPARNRPPDAPPPAVARVFAGSAISVFLPLAGIDPDGDWVTVQSIEQPEAPLGQVRVSGADALTYTAFDAPGVDRIRYLVTDPAGATATGELTVLVVAPADAARPPVAPDQTVSVRPGSSVRVDPLAAVVDPGGQAVRLADPAFTVTPGLDVQVEDRGFVLTAPAEPTVGTLRYTVVNAKGLTATGTVRVTVSPDAPMPYPVATDVFVQPADLTADTGTVDVDLSAAVTNRSGRADRLTVSVDPLSAPVAAVVDGHTVRVTVSTVRQVVAYRVVDGNGAQAGAFIVVPPRAQLVGPQLRAGAGPIDLAAGLSVDVAIGDYVTVGGTGQDAVTIASTPAPRLTQGTAVRTSATVLTLSAPATAGGAAAVYVPIETGTGTAAGGGGAPVVLSIPVRIEPRLIPPPRIDSTEVPVEAGGSTAIDLAALTTTYDGRQAGSVSWGVGPGGSGVSTAIRGSTVTVTAAADVPRGTRVELPMDVTDGDGKNGRGTLTVTVTGSTRPLPTVVDQQVAQGLGGTPVTVDMLTGSDDPVGLGLTVAGARVLDGAAGIAAGPTVAGGSVSLTPAAGFVGELVVAVDVLDGTRDPDRQVTATLRVRIQDRPGAPGVPSAVPGTITARSVQLQWEPAAANGAPVQQYTVAGGGLRQECPGSDSTCVITGLTPGQAAVFVVTAINAVGESPASAPSAVILPDVTPAVPAAPVAQYVARGEISVAWSVPAGDFTPVTAMSLQVLRGDGAGEVVQVIDAATSPTVLSGLDSAAGYRFQVRAANQQGVSDWSAPSGTVVPSGVPSAPTGVAAQFVFDAGRRGVEVTWGPPDDDGGEPITAYRLTLGGADAGTGDGAWRSAFLPVEGNDPVAVAVVAGNGRGEGPAATASVAPFGRPAAVGGLAVTPGDSSLALAWNPADSPGRPVADYQYRLDDGDWVGVGPATTATVRSLANGTAHQVQVRACNGESGFDEDVRCGPAGDPVTGTPAGPLAEPKVTVTVPDQWGRTVQVDWTFPGGNGREVTAQTVTIDGADIAPRPTSWSRDVGYGATVTATVAYCVGTGADRDCREATARGATATLFTVATRALAPLTGTCATPSPYPGEWRTEDTCAPGTWVPAPRAADLLCVRTGPAYPALPAGGPGPVPGEQVTAWYQDKDRLWYRKPVFVNPDSKIPTC